MATSGLDGLASAADDLDDEGDEEDEVRILFSRIDLCEDHPDGVEWFQVDLEPEELEELERYRGMKISLNQRHFPVKSRAREVKLRARKRGALAGPEDDFSVKLQKVGAMTGTQRWMEYQKRARLLDGDPLEPEEEREPMAKPVKGAKAKASVEWFNPGLPPALGSSKCCTWKSARTM
jgi:hypothetical protein